MLKERLNSENANFAKTVEICRTREQGKEQCEAIQAGASSKANVNAVSDIKVKRCGRCARKHEANRRCPAKGRTCNKCGQRNHFAVACRTQSYKAPVSKDRLAAIEAQEENFWIDAVSRSTEKGDRWSATVKIEGTPVLCKLDTGANCSVIAKKKLHEITNKRDES